MRRDEGRGGFCFLFSFESITRNAIRCVAWGYLFYLSCLASPMTRPIWRLKGVEDYYLQEL